MYYIVIKFTNLLLKHMITFMQLGEITNRV